MKNILYVAVGGAVGSVLRYLLSKVVAFAITDTFPWATLVVNVLGCFVMGILLGITAKSTLSMELKCLLMVGFCGGFTTFSTFAAECLTLIKGQDFLYLALYLTLSLWAGITALWLGQKVA